MEFKELKEKFIKRCKENNACSDEFKRVLGSKNKKQLLQVIKDNMKWCYRETNTVTIKVLDWFGSELCNELGIYYKGIEKRIEGKKDLIFLGDFNCNLLYSSQVGEMWDSSQVGEMLDSSQVGEMLDSSQVGKMLGSSQVGEMLDSSQVGKMLGSSQVGKMLDSSQVGKMLGSSQVGKMLGSSQVGEMLGSSQVGKMLGSSQVGKMWDSSQVGEMWDSSQVGEMLGSSTVRIGKGYFSGNFKNIKSQNDNSQIIDLQNNKIYIKKSKFEIVEV